MPQTQAINTAQLVTSSYKSLHRFLELSQTALADGCQITMRDYANAAREVLIALDHALDYSCGRLADDMHAVYAYMIRLIDKAVLGQDSIWRLTACLELSASLARAWKKAAPDA